MIDITHGIAPTNVLQGALVLANTLPYMPVGVHLAVVDPGVGGDRKPVALRGGDGRLYVGPDNGLLLVAAERHGGVEAAVELVEPAYRLEPVARTFHGRDIFAPAAAHLAAGVELGALGPALPAAELVRLELPAPEVGTRRIRATVLYVDRFGNVQLNLTRAELDRVGIEPGSQVEVEVGFERYFAIAAATFAEVRAGDIVLYEDAYRNVALAINKGSAAEMFGVVVGQELGLRARRRVNDLALAAGKKLARVATRAVVARPALWRVFRWPLARPVRRAGAGVERDDRPDDARPSSPPRSTASARSPPACSTSAPAPARRPCSWRSGFPLRRSSASTWRRRWSRRRGACFLPSWPVASASRWPTRRRCRFPTAPSTSSPS